jgi:hypothetical protein
VIAQTKTVLNALKEQCDTEDGGNSRFDSGYARATLSVEQIQLGVPATDGSAEPVGGCLAVEGIHEVPA